jgi:hypothetical protein
MEPVMRKKISILAPEIALLPVKRFAITAWMMILTVQQTVKTAIASPRLLASAESRTLHVNQGANAAPMFVEKVGVRLD